MIHPLKERVFLFSVDLEDVRDSIPNGNQLREAVPVNTIKYLDWLDTVQSKATFFTVGNTARCYPDLIKEIMHRGHEIACHTDTHIQLTNFSEPEFRKDLDSFFETMAMIGVSDITGFRAPIFSLTEKSMWVYKVLREYKFGYSSSVLPYKNVLYGWPGFQGEGYYEDIYELPMNIGYWPFRIPFGGGVYFRLLPSVLLATLFRYTFSQRKAVLSYMHPYDVDTEQEKFMHPNILDSHALNWAMYANRDRVFKRLNYLRSQLDFHIMRYDEYLSDKIKT